LDSEVFSELSGFQIFFPEMLRKSLDYYFVKDHKMYYTFYVIVKGEKPLSKRDLTKFFRCL